MTVRPTSGETWADDEAAVAGVDVGEVPEDRKVCAPHLRRIAAAHTG
jgi:hypothetical protein